MADKTFKLNIILEAENARLRTQLEKSRRDVERFRDRARRSLRGFSNDFRTAIGAVAGFQLGRNVINTLRQTEIQFAQLKTATGSLQAANAEFEKLQKFAATTPFALSESVDAFVKLKNLGLDPSIDSLKSYANFAAGAGKSLNQVIEAIADAATFQFERLRELGITTKTQGDEVQLTFRGVTTTVRKEASAIVGFLRNIGDVEFAGAIDERAATLDGALSNLGDAFDALVIKVGQAGLTRSLNAIARALSNVAEKAGDATTALQGYAQLDSIAESSNDQIIARLAFLRSEIKATELSIERARSPTFGNTQVFDVDTKAAQQRLRALRIEFDALQEALRTRPLLEAAKSGAQPDDKPPLPKPPTPSKPDRTLEANRKAIAQTIAELEKQIVVQGLSEKQTLAYELQLRGATKEQIQYALQLKETVISAALFEEAQQAEVDAIKESVEATRRKRQELEEFGDATTRAVFPAIQLADEMTRLKEALDAGVITKTVFDQAQLQAAERFRDTVKETNEELKDGKSFAEEFGLTFSSALEDAIVQGANFRDILKGIEQDILRIVTRQLVTEPLGTAISGASKSLFGGSFQSFFANLLPFQFGGAFTVGGSGGVDSQLVAFRATPGEKVVVSPPGKSGEAQTANIVINVTTPDADSFRRSEDQLGRRAFYALQRGLRFQER